MNPSKNNHLLGLKINNDMKYYIISLVLSFLLVSAYGQPKKENLKAPDIYFENVAGDFGTVTEGEKPVVIFTFHNSGTSPLLLKNLKPSCGCTVPEYPKEPIMPGKSGTIKVEFNSNGYANQKVHKSIAVTTNIPEGGVDKVVIIYIKGFVAK